MGRYSVIPAVLGRLAEIPQLDADIVEDYTQPKTNRPVLRPIVSVGSKDFRMIPTSRFKHTIVSAVRLTFLFPFGYPGAQISETLYRVSAAFSGRIYNEFLVESIDLGSPVFNSDMHGIKAELYLNMKMTGSIMDPLETSGGETYRIGNVSFDRFPQRVIESREKGNNPEMSRSPRVFTLEGESSYGLDRSLWSNLHSLMSSDTPFDLTLPRGDKAVKVKPTSILTESDTCGYGCKYKLTFTEVL